VVIVGAGIAGLTVAHELVRTGKFDIEVLEKRERAGGKARTTGQGSAFREHSMRILPGSYVCMHQVMAEIADGDGGRVIDHLRPATIVIQHGARRTVVRGAYAHLGGSLRYAFDVARLAWFLRRSGVSFRELVVFTYKILSLLFIPERKVILNLSRLKFSEYLNGGIPSPGFDGVIFRIAEILVAAKSYASASVVARTLLEWFVTPFLVGKHVRHAVSELDAPTSDALIEPWVRQLEGQGVHFRFGHATTAVAARGGRITAISVAADGKTREVKADAYVLAVQHNIADALLTPPLKRYLPALATFASLGEEWAHSVQFFVRDLPPSLRKLGLNSVAVIESPWSIGYKVYSRGTFNPKAWMRLGLGDDQAIVTATISNSNRAGIVHHLPLLRCNKAQILEEVVKQTGLGPHLDLAAGDLGLDIDLLPEDQVDQDALLGYSVAAIGRPDESLAFVSDSLMYIRLPGNLDLEPANATAVYNLFLAGEYTRTNYGIPTMEKSCESGKRCAQGVVAGFGMATDPERVPECDLPLGILRTELFALALRLLLWLGVIAALGWLWIQRP
jgi:uncharacterized protein with NAD-binding domain and iron-sulfur cluster